MAEEVGEDWFACQAAGREQGSHRKLKPTNHTSSFRSGGSPVWRLERLRGLGVGKGRAQRVVRPCAAIALPLGKCYGMGMSRAGVDGFGGRWRAGWAVWGLCAFPALAGEEAILTARTVYAEVGGKVRGVKPETRQAEDANGYPLDARIWKLAGVIRKLETVVSEDHGAQTTEFYYTAEAGLVFALQTTTTERVDTGEVVNRREERFYWDAGTGDLVQWLDADKQAVSPVDGEFGVRAAALSDLEAEGLALFAGDELAAAKEKVIDRGTATGVFEGIEEGDYFHLRLRLADGEELTYLILRSEGLLDKVVENPGRYAGKKLKVHWEEKVLDIPEAGGKQQMTVCVRVEQP